MMWLLAIIVVSFGFVIFRGAPYVKSKKFSVIDAMDLLDLKEGQSVCDLGCGNGYVLKQFSDQGIKAYGYEINPVLYLICRLRFMNDKNVQVYYGDFYFANLERYDAFYVFSAGPYLDSIAKKLARYPGKKVVSVGFKLPRLKAAGKSDRVVLYHT